MDDGAVRSRRVRYVRSNSGTLRSRLLGAGAGAITVAVAVALLLL